MRQFINDEGIKFSSFIESALSKSYHEPDDFNRSAILEFLTFGSVYGEKTFLSRIKKQVTHQPYLLKSDEGLSSVEQFKENPLLCRDNISIDEAKNYTLKYFQSLKSILSRKKISVDLTGGIDSRFIIAILTHFDIPFDAVYSRISGDEREQSIVERIAREFAISLKIIYQPGAIHTTSEIRDLIELGDAMWDPLGLRSLQMAQSWRMKNKYDLAITGVGGELYKDFWWQQDFPFYRKKNPNIDRLLNMRMYPVKLPKMWFGKKIRSEFDDFISNFRTHLRSYKQDFNTQTYDQIYYHLRIKEQISVLSHTTAKFLPVWSPLLEPELLVIGYNLNRRHRFFNRFHRAVISECAPKLAVIPTTDGGMTVSEKPGHLAADLFRFVVNKSQRILSKSKGEGSEAGKKSMDDVILTHVFESVQRLKQVGILSGQAPDDPEHYPETLYGRIILIGYHAEMLE